MFFDKVIFNKSMNLWGFMFKKISVENVYQSLLESQVKLLSRCLLPGAGKKEVTKLIVVILVIVFGIKQV